MNFILIAVIVLGAIALISAIVLYAVSKKFAVQEDPRIGQVVELLPGANCGGCGFAGCAGMADALVKGADLGSIDGLMCPVGGADVMGQVADLLGMAVANTYPMVAVVRCNGTCEHRPRIVEYDGLHSCHAVNATCAGETGCGFGCLGCGDCVAACQFGAITMDEETGLPVVEDRLAKLASHQATIKARRYIEGGDEELASKHICFGYHAKLTTYMPSIDRLEWRLIVGRELGKVHNLSTIHKFPPVQVLPIVGRTVGKHRMRGFDIRACGMRWAHLKPAGIPEYR